MRKRLALIVGLVAAIGAASAVHAEQVLQIAATRIPQIYDPDAPGPYDAILAQLTKGFALEVNVDVMPPRRALRVFASKRVDCYFVSSDREDFFRRRGLPWSELIHSDPINTLTARIYSLQSQPLITSIDQIHGKTIAVDLSVGEATELNQHFFGGRAVTLPVGSVGQALSLLEQDRAVGAILFDYDVRNHAKAEGVEGQVHVSPALVISQLNDTVTCWSGDKTHAFLRHINSTLAALRETGQLQTLLMPPW